MDYIQSIVLGIVQGLGEFLPISSSGHLILAPYIFGWPDHGLIFDIALHLGTLVALVIYYRALWIRLFKSVFRIRSLSLQKLNADPDHRTILFLIVGTFPAAIVGLMIEDIVENFFRVPALVATTLIIMGFGLWAADRFGKKKKSFTEIGYKDVLVVGFSQCLALVPGVSRSGITISTSLVRGFERAAAAELSFYLSMPITLGACILKLRHLTAADITPEFLIGIITAGISGYLAISVLLRFVKTKSYFVFAVYRFILGAIVIAMILLR